MFTHLHTHSYYSFLDGIPSPKALVEHAMKDGMRSLALTDHYGLTGAIEFYESCVESGIKPILGLEITLRHPLGTGNLVLLCKNLAGWSNLCRLSSSAHCSPDRDPTNGITQDTLAEFSSGLICLSGGKRGLSSRVQDSTVQLYLGQIADIFKNHFYMELQSQEPGDAKSIRRLVSIASRLDIPLVATNNVHYISAEARQLQMILSAIRTNSSLNGLITDAPAPPGSYFKSRQEMVQQFKDLPASITNTLDISDRCNLELPLGNPHYPEISLPPGETAIGRLRGLAENGAVQKYGNITPAIRERLSHELSVIHDRGYAPLFLIVQEILEFARKTGVPISSRGSAASSLVAYCLGITTPDPMDLNLYFERFLNPARSSPPDIDTDLCSRRRAIVIQHVYQRYGVDRVAMVATINHFQHRSALREVSKAYGISSEIIKQLTAALPSRSWVPSDGRRRSQMNDPFEELKTKFPDAIIHSVLQDAIKLVGLPRHLSVHPGGIVITPEAMTNLVPTHLANKGILITQFDLKSIESLGLVKIDLLGTRGLTVLGDVAGKVREWRCLEFPDSISVLESIPNDDPDTSTLLQSTNTIGCFAIESPGMRATLREIGATTPEDIMVALALYRPGPMTGGLKDSFIRRHLGKEPVQHLHPALVSLLDNTHGVILYQEQVLRIASELAGLSLSDADLLRRAMSHFDPGDQMKTLKNRFINGALATSGVSGPVSEQIWELMAAFAGYGFPKAHAASYAQVAWRSVWCKSHYPAEFMAAVLAGWGGYYRQNVYINEARHLKLVISPPHINHSQQQFAAVYPQGHPILFMGLSQVRELSRVTQKRIIAHRPFHSLDDFLTRVDPRLKEVQNLIRVGALDGLGKIPELLIRVKAGGWQIGQPRLFDIDYLGGHKNDWELKDRFAAQKEILGIGVEAHPVEMIGDFLAEVGTVTIHQALQMVGSDVQVVGIRQTIHRFHSTNGKIYHLLELDDSVGVLHVRFSEQLYRQHRNTISTHDPFLVSGHMVDDPDSGLVYLDVQTISRVDQNHGERL